MRNLIKYSVIYSSILLFAASCEKDNDNNTSENKSAAVIDATSESAWKYYSFSKGDTVKVADAQNSTEWDIAFQRYRVKTNGGKSGKGQAAAFMTSLKGQAGFDALIQVPDTAVFATDDTVVVYGYNPANPSKPTETKYILNAPLYGWYTLQQGAATALVANNNIYVLKTATGKYVKLWIQSYYNDADAKPGYIKIKYFYQKDGSNKLE